ncbi:MAG TPA: HAMP domain-containing sensor histidine kinase [Patescibacteria group bacterium]|nr:HAMP domain-containing sensor histidine kinase [Patescibacteria group bacterium]
MFARARRRLALRYLLVLAGVLAVFSLVFLVAIAVVLRPAFEIAEDSTTDEAVHRAYERSLQRIALALVVADGAVVVLVGGAAYLLADRTLRPIQEAHERQRRFVADASHEMRTPLAAIRSTAESALAEPVDPSGQTSALRTILGASERLTELTDDLLILARSERGTLERHPERFDLSVVTAEVVEAQRTSGGAADAIALNMATDLGVEADEDDVRRILANLLDNALRYGAGGPVRVRTLAVDGQAVVEIADRGPGIAAADLDRIFDPFYRVRADATAPPGTGLGLAIAADLARRNGGRLTVDSRPGDGAAFRLSLARAA